MPGEVQEQGHEVPFRLQCQTCGLSEELHLGVDCLYRNVFVTPQRQVSANVRPITRCVVSSSEHEECYRVLTVTPLYPRVLTVTPLYPRVLIVTTLHPLRLQYSLSASRENGKMDLSGITMFGRCDWTSSRCDMLLVVLSDVFLISYQFRISDCERNLQHTHNEYNVLLFNIT